MNTVVAQLGRTASRWQQTFLWHLGYKAFHEPTGGWEPHHFERDHSWEQFLEARRRCNPRFADTDEGLRQKLCGFDLAAVIDANQYVEIGFSVLPFLRAVPPTWRALGVVRHPQDWIYSACEMDFYWNLISWHPATPADYAQLWAQYTALILERCSEVFRMEDFDQNPEPFARAFGYEGVILDEWTGLTENFQGTDFRHIGPRRLAVRQQLRQEDDVSWWPVVASIAERLGYQRQ